MDPLSILTKEQIKTLNLTEEQLYQLSNLKSFEDILCEYNELLSEFLKTLYFCPHDSDYRLNHNDEEDDRIRSILEKLLNYQKTYHLNNKVYIYCKNYYKLDNYVYKIKNVYAGTHYFVVPKSEFHTFCQQRSLNPSNFIAPLHSCWNPIEPKTFTSWMNNQHNYVYRLPYNIDITCPKTSDEFGHNYGNKINIFEDMQFIDVLKLKDNL
jgi:hypothetical protein